jgi:hypothetical protein
VQRTRADANFFAVRPGQAERSHVGTSEAGDGCRDLFRVLRLELAVYQRLLSPVHKLCERSSVSQKPGDFLRDMLFRYIIQVTKAVSSS